MNPLASARRILEILLAQRATSLRIGLSFVVPLAIGAALDHVAYGALATQGAFAATYARNEPYRWRLRVMLAVGAGLTLAVVLGTLAAFSPWTMALGAGLVAGTAAILMLAWDVGPPREFMIVLAYLAATSFPGDASDVPLRAALVMGGALLVTAIGVSGWLIRPRGPEERALERAYLALARLVEAVGTDQAQAVRHQALVALEETRSVLIRAGDRRQQGDRLTKMAVAGEAVLDTVLGLVLRAEQPLDPRWASLIRTMAASVREPELGRDLEGPPETPGTKHGPRFVTTMDRALRAADPERILDATLVPFGPRKSRRRVARLRRAMRPGSLVVPTAARAAVAVAAGTGLGLLTGVDHGVWVGLTAAAVLQASNVSLTGKRTLQRAVGTVVGVGVAAAILAGHPSIAVIIVALAVCQTVTQATAATAYGVATVFATPIALMIVEVGRPGTPADTLLQERVVDTLLGCAVGLGARRFLWPRTAATQLPHAQGAAIEAVHDVLHAALTRADHPSSDRIRRSRRALHTALINLRAVHQDAIGDLVWSAGAADARWTTTTAVQRLAHTAMAVPAPPDAAPPDREQVAQLDAALTALAAIAQGHRAPALVPIPPMPDHPATHRALVELREVLRLADGEAEGVGDEVSAER